MRQRKIEIGLPAEETEERTESLRNKGLNLTPVKREMLWQIQERCEQLGIQPIKA